MNIFKYLFIFIFITGCQQKDNSITSLEKNKIKSTRNNESNSISLDGVWIRTDYLEILNKTKSPFKSFYGLKDISCLNIQHTNDESKFDVFLLLNNVESSNAVLTINKENKLTLHLYWGDGNIDTSITIKGNLLSFKLNNKLFIFKKTNNVFGSDDEFGIQYLTNEILFDNYNYNAFKSDNKNKSCFNNVKFMKNGQLLNFDVYNEFQIQTSFIEDSNPKDYIVLKNTKNNLSKIYNYVFNGKDIYLYNIIKIKDSIHSEDDENYEEKEKTELAYILKKISD